MEKLILYGYWCFFLKFWNYCSVANIVYICTSNIFNFYILSAVICMSNDSTVTVERKSADSVKTPKKEIKAKQNNNNQWEREKEGDRNSCFSAIKCYENFKFNNKKECQMIIKSKRQIVSGWYIYMYVFNAQYFYCKRKRCLVATEI